MTSSTRFAAVFLSLALSAPALAQVPPAPAPMPAPAPAPAPEGPPPAQVLDPETPAAGDGARVEVEAEAEPASEIEASADAPGADLTAAASTGAAPTSSADLLPLAARPLLLQNGRVELATQLRTMMYDLGDSDSSAGDFGDMIYNRTGARIGLGAGELRLGGIYLVKEGDASGGADRLGNLAAGVSVTVARDAALGLDATLNNPTTDFKSYILQPHYAVHRLLSSQFAVLARGGMNFQQSLDGSSDYYVLFADLDAAGRIQATPQLGFELGLNLLLHLADNVDDFSIPSQTNLRARATFTPTPQVDLFAELLLLDSYADPKEFALGAAFRLP